MFLSRSTLGKIETTPQIGEGPRKRSRQRNINHKRKYKESLHDQTYARSGVVAERQTASREYLKYALDNVKWAVHPLSNL